MIRIPVWIRSTVIYGTPQGLLRCGFSEAVMQVAYVCLCCVSHYDTHLDPGVRGGLGRIRESLPNPSAGRDEKPLVLSCADTDLLQTLQRPSLLIRALFGYPACHRVRSCEPPQERSCEPDYHANVVDQARWS